MTTDARSQFVASGGAPSQQNYFKSSLSLMCADTRGGVTPQVAAEINTVKQYGGAHPESQARITGYLERVQASAGAGNDSKPATVARAKPATAMK